MTPLHVIHRLETEAKLARAELRQLEHDVGRSATADGRYWLLRTAALEGVAAAAERAIRSGDLTWLRETVDALNAIPVPACNENDHMIEAA